ncbi:MAG: transposase [Janthinobacterium lividum]
MAECCQPLTDSQWQVIAPLLPVHRKRRHWLLLLVDAMRYICRTGCQWRCLPSSFAPWLAVCYYFRRWQRNGLWQTLTNAVNQADRLAAGRPVTLSLVCLDSQRVRLAPRVFEHRGLGCGKHVNGRKRQILTNVQGRILACRVHAALKAGV